jgi:2-polyprenyl-3-methyl-5-hydroxy-6-metoxy-1,4-benzoquinol methylase
VDIETYAQSIHFYADDVPPFLTRTLSNRTWTSLMDVGCGDGSLLHALKVRGILNNHKKVFAADLSETRIERVKAIDPAFTCFVSPADELKTIESGSLDFVVSTQVIEHVPSDAKMAAELARILRPGGTLFLSTVFKKWYGWYFYRCNGKWTLDPTHVREYLGESDLHGYLSQNGLTLESQEKHLFKFPAVDFVLKRIGVGTDVYRHRLLKGVRRIQIPIVGYYDWQMVWVKK